jgi:hypothetical protein
MRPRRWASRTSGRSRGGSWDPQEDEDFVCPRCLGECIEPSDERLDHIHAIAQEHLREAA